VQGAEAAPAIVRALTAANRHGWGQAIILGRGGGSLEDLWPFNEEAVARAVFASTLPVVSAVGHETDFSITDFVADLRAPTPSAAAELLTPDRAVLQRALAASQLQLAARMQDALARLGQRHDHLAQRLASQHPGRRLAEHTKLLTALSARLRSATARGIPDRKRTLDAINQRLQQAGKRLVPTRQQSLAALARTLHAVSPLPTLERGYSVTMDADSGTAIQSVSDVQAGQVLRTQLRDGRIVSRVETTEKGNLKGS
jgi:exodeoxyribonuclease VII large subunit